MNLDQMWEELARYQPYAEKRGFGPEWLRMTTDKTSKAALGAELAASDVETAEELAATAAWWAARAVRSMALNREARAVLFAESSIEHITRAIELENKP